MLVRGTEGGKMKIWKMNNTTADPSGRPRGLRRGSAVARLLRLWVRISPGHKCVSVVSVVCCQVEVSASCRSLVQRSPTDCSVSECDRESSIMRVAWSTGGLLHRVRNTDRNKKRRRKMTK